MNPMNFFENLDVSKSIFERVVSGFVKMYKLRIIVLKEDFKIYKN